MDKELLMIATNVELQDICSHYKDDIIDFYFNTFDKNNGQYSLVYNNLEFNNTVAPILENVMHEFFYLGPKTQHNYINVYVQSNEKYYGGTIHNHFRTASLSSVFYYNLPDCGGELDIYYPHLEEKQFVIDRVPVQEDVMYMFPNWLYHCPVEQEDNDFRISFNYDYVCRERPILKKTGTMW